jgi:molecular chaperone GrpE
MDEKNEKIEDLSEETAAKEAAEKEEGAAEEKTAEELSREIAALKEELKEKDDKYLRMAAEYDNFRRRSREEKSAAYEVALSDTVTEFLGIIDNLERAALYDDETKVKDGLVMIAKSVEAALQKLGVEAIGAVGDKFDPNLHNAVMHVDDEAYGEGEIIEVFQKGYKKGSRIIRFAMVKTAN